MPAIYQRTLAILILVLSGFLSMNSHAQRKLGLEPDNWARELSKKGLTEVNSMGSLSTLLLEADSLRALRFLDSVEASKNAKGYYFRTYFNMVKSDFLYRKFAGLDKYKDRSSKQLQPIKEELMKLYAGALNAVYRTENDLAIGWVNFYSARRMRYFGEIGWAVMYSKNGVDLFEKVNYPVEPPVYVELAELLFNVKEYDEADLNARKSIRAWKFNNYDSGYADSYRYKIRALNIIGNIFYQRNRYDSAEAYYRQALNFAVKHNDTLRTGIVSGNIGRLHFARRNYDSAYSLFQADYKNSSLLNIHDNAAGASVWAARTSLAKGSQSLALSEVREALRLLSLWPNGPFLRDSYQTLTQIYRAMGNYDSAFHYNDRYMALHDSLEKEIATSSLAIAKVKLNDEVSRFNIEKLNREKKTELLWRNIIIGFIVFASLIALLVINRQRLKQKFMTEKAEQEKRLIEQEMNSAKEQMKMFTENIIEKTSLIEKLESQVRGKEASAEQHAIMAELTQQSILTEDDWNRFRTMYEKLYPGFFLNLKEKFHDITIAEQRMAALTRLRLTTRQIATMLGISVDSVHKSRQRLRQRFQVGTETNLDEVVAGL